MKTNPANEIKEYNDLGICMKDFANRFGMACGCNKCYKEVLDFIENKE